MQQLCALVLTIVVEALVMLALSRSKTWVFYNLLCNLVTNTLLNALLAGVALAGSLQLYYAVLVVGEVVVLFTEAWLYRLLSDAAFKTCFMRSLLTNLASLVLGWIVL